MRARAGHRHRRGRRERRCWTSYGGVADEAMNRAEQMQHDDLSNDLLSFSMTQSICVCLSVYCTFMDAEMQRGWDGDW
jgi:hypothetical protein